MTDTRAADPLWYKDAVIYELHVRAFFDSTGDGVGDFPGLTSKLDYLQDLGVDCLWLLPFYPSPLRDDGYDIANYEAVHPSYGTLRDFKTFLREAHARGMRVVTELVINHTSDQHPWFQAARKAPPGSAKRDYYVWSDTNRRYDGVRIIFTDSEPSNWTWDPEAGAYYWHRFFRHQPDLNFDNPRVQRAVLKWMKFWLDMGVDGLRLDAIPYLFEREGTNCENLPETHEFLKRIRREVDERYQARMLLAEANQWPADVRAYFGQGDECHMAFHFPLMPRIFMALQLEDAHPVVEILRQTPAIPESSQWALFLRNHDELTLEMVTDEERDYMYRAYAADPQMRINVGIRRRLAPLMENNRQRVELLYCLLFTLPGTPIIYYGDEIGMGDNIYLGDRNGVRTPMQWTGDRNAGFSTADPARLFAPPIMDAVYGYQALNVEAQQRSPFSLLNFVRRFIALRRQHGLFGRGSLTFLNTSNRRVIAYLRQHEGRTVLVVANLSRSVQPALVDLSRFSGLVPTEMRDQTAFPRIGEAPYFLSLGGYAFLLFELRPFEEDLIVRTVPEAEAPPRAVYASGAWETMLEGSVRHLIERDFLRDFVLRQRWFPGKARRLDHAEIADWAVFTRGHEPSFLWIVDATYDEGPAERFFMPVATASGEAAHSLQHDHPAAIVARVSGARKGVVHDGFQDGVARALLLAIETGRTLTMRGGTVRARRTAAYDEVRGGESAATLPARRVGGEQSNTSFIYGEAFILKVIRRLEPGLNPDFEVLRHLTERIGFAHVPRLAGHIEYEDREGATTTLGVLTALVEHQATGWDQALDQARRFFDRALASSQRLSPEITRPASLLQLIETPVPLVVLDTVGGLLESAVTLGRRTAALHLALATSDGDEAFEPEPFGEAERADLATSMRALATSAIDTLAHRSGHAPESLRDDISRLVARRPAILESFDQLSTVAAGGQRTRVHGDYHLGQVLWNQGDFIILDFEGEPMRPLAERRAKHPPIKDVAGMLRSFSYAAYAALFEYTATRPRDFERLEPWAHLAETWTSVLFLRAYRDTLGGSPIVPHDDKAFEVLLNAYLTEKALYELQYELGNRPDWLRIPLVGLLAMFPEPWEA
ncbi:MAG: maltose alpha-D-glucosyltransferase [Vicinamibacteraceae bacterium]|nr:maltose alpha-D-glucosyltransferase [Vicinamibacteraceae bacterium]